MGVAYLQQGKFPEAVKALQQAANLSPEQASVKLALGTAFVHQENTTAGLTNFEQAAKLVPRNAQIYLQIGKILQA